MAMNREQRRRRNREINKKNPIIQNLIKASQDAFKMNRFKTGDLVRLDVSAIMSSHEFNKLQYEYQEFVKNARDKTFHVIVEEKYKKMNLVALQEDTTEPRWLFWNGYFKRVKEEASV
jgi:ribosomal protein L21E